MARTARLLLGLALLTIATAAPARTILFIGNSFTFGDKSAVRHYRPDLVTDLNGEGIGGVPALVATFAREGGLDWRISLETSPGKPLWWHEENRRTQIYRQWDTVVLQGYSTLDPDRPGDAARHIASAGRLAHLFRFANPRTEIDLVATWSRADLTYRPGGHWYGRPIEAMEEDLEAASAQALREVPDLAAIVPVGRAWTKAMHLGIADPDPYDGTSYGKISLWSWDQYHASNEGYYLEALVLFGRLSGHDPRRLGATEEAATALGLNPAIVTALQRVAYETLATEPRTLRR